MSHDDLKHGGFKDRTRIDEARERLLDEVSPHARTEHAPLGSADGRTIASRITAPNPVPSYDRAAMDGYAVRAEDTFGASDRSPNVLRTGEEIGPEIAARVHTGSDLPAGADAVVMIEQVEELGEEIEVFDAVAEGENVGDAGEDVAKGQRLYEPGHRIRPSDLGLLKSVGLDAVEVAERPTAAVIPTGEELVQTDPGPGEIIETNGLTVSRLVDRWGGRPTYRDVVTDDREALRAAIQRDLTKDLIVTTGGSSVGERDLIPEVVDDLGEVLVHGVALKPGHPVALGVVEDTPVIMLPGYPVACIVNAVQFLRPALKRVGGMPIEDHPTTEARLGRKIRSEPGVRTFARVKLEEEEGERTVEPTRVSGSGVLSSVALADGWVVVPEEREGIAEGERVAVEDWEWSA
ncbi:molybdopterin molybdotransferase MoeA [Halalkalicoccus salilacus]|uniref:molybdopterin molybdotransferase MoeA n=1 Tax=Halalkalicoccus salilacus TaxID=3117459 RepID=UPI00300F712F